MRCAIWYDLYNFKNVKNSHGGVLLLIKFQEYTRFAAIYYFFLQKIFK